MNVYMPREGGWDDPKIFSFLSLLLLALSSHCFHILTVEEGILFLKSKVLKERACE